jgi:pyruvate,orthophosphate dikinase
MGWVYDFDAPPAGSASELTALLGGKGANLVVMAHELGLPVPPGFVVTTEACRHFLGGGWPKGLDEELRQHMERLGGLTGRRFGDPADPLLVSVRSGAPVSMPGMMDTLLDLGVTATSLAGLARSTGSTDFAADCRRRLAEGWRAVIGDGDVPDDPWLQLRAAVEAVFQSWNSERAKAYREREGIADDLGTAVTVQAMVFGNRGQDSGTGVLFTRNPSTGEPVLYGDFMFDAQGEDVVAGTHETMRLSVLAERLPDVDAELGRYGAVLEHHLADMADVEFTVEEGRLWLLQVRAGKRSPRAALRIAIDMAEDPEFPLSRKQAVQRVLPLLANPPRLFRPAGDVPQPMTSGLPASPGVASGVIALSSESAEALAASGSSVILVRSETSPEDVRGMSKAAGVLTARGGLASHAAVVARGWGIPAVVGAADVKPADDHVLVNSRRLAAADVITIDGSTGNVYLGELAGRWEVAPEAATVLEWATALGIEVPAPEAPGQLTPANAATVGEVTSEDLVLALAIKGVTPVARLAEAVQAADVGSLVARLKAEGLAEVVGTDARLTAHGKLAATDRFGADRAALGEGRSGEVLQEFHAFDGRMKEIITAWQLREADGVQAPNDHSDAAYDQRVLDDLASLHAQTSAWLRPLADKWRRFIVYRDRLARALDAARGGDQRFVASPRVDSYHSVWFELHEDLIRLAGATRSE